MTSWANRKAVAGGVVVVVIAAISIGCEAQATENLLPAEQVNPAWKANWGERAAWSRRPVAICNSAAIIAASRLSGRSFLTSMTSNWACR